MFRKIGFIVFCFFCISSKSFSLQQTSSDILSLKKQSGFYRVSYESVSMPQGNASMGLMGIHYFADILPWLYGGVGSYGAITGNQGGLFTLGLGGGVHGPLSSRWQGDAGLYAGGGGGKASTQWVGGGLMLKPYLGVTYLWKNYRFGLFYSYINFPSGEIRSHQLGINIDFLNDLYYLDAKYAGCTFCSLKKIIFPNNENIFLQRNDFSLLLQAYRQLPGTQNLTGGSESGTMGLVGAELDHLITTRFFSWIRADGAFHGATNGYMDVLGGVGYKWLLMQKDNGVAFVAQGGVGAGGGGNIDTGGGLLVQPQLGIEWPLSSQWSARVRGGYLWAPTGHFQAASATADVLYHLDFISDEGYSPANCFSPYAVRGWQAQIVNQTYLSPQRASSSVNSVINTVAIQIDQLFTPYFFMSYQAASAYQGYQAGGYATGMIGPGLQLAFDEDRHFQPFVTLLLGAAGGGGLDVQGGAVIEPVLGVRYRFAENMNIEGSVGDLHAFHGSLNTPVVNVGLSMAFGILENA